MNERHRDAAIGLAAIAAAAATVSMLISFGSLRELARPSHDVVVRLNQAGGLRYGSQITLDGVPIGTIAEVGLEIDQALPVRLDCRVDDWVRIPVDHLVQVEAALIGGGARLAILSLDPASDRAVFSAAETPVLEGTFLSLGDALSGSLDARMGPITASFAEVGDLARTYRELGERLNTLVAEGGNDGTGLGETLQRINGTLGQAEEAFAAATAWLGDEQLRADARDAVFKANLFIERATDAALAASRLATTLDGEAPALAQRLASTADAVDATLGEVRLLVDVAARGEGTIGRLLQDPALYDDLDDAAKRLDATLETLRILIEAIKAEGVKIEF
jgi:phospholipid/cholesterol/gamma-HCH transport system substrate-binding protein